MVASSQWLRIHKVFGLGLVWLVFVKDVVSPQATPIGRVKGGGECRKSSLCALYVHCARRAGSIPMLLIQQKGKQVCKRELRAHLEAFGCWV